MGESAGAASAHFQATATSYANDGLFQRIILQSGSANCPWAWTSKTSAASAASRLLEISGCNSLAQLQLASFDDLVKAAIKINGLGHNLFRPTPDASDFFGGLSLRPSLGCPLASLVGLNADEGAFLTAGLLGSGEAGLKRASRLLQAALLLHDKSEANEVRRHYLEGEAINWTTADHLTRAISDGLFGYPLQLFLQSTVG